MNLKVLLAAGALALTPAIASAATIIGQLDITGQAITRDLTDAVAGDVVAGGSAADTAGTDVTFIDLDAGTAGTQAFVTGASGTFAAEGLTPGTMAEMFDIDFSAAPTNVYQVGIFTFEAQSFHSFLQTAIPSNKSFTASGVLSAVGYTDTIAVMSFTSQNADVAVSFSTTTTVPLPAGVLLMGTAIAGFGVMRRRKKAA